MILVFPIVGGFVMAMTIRVAIPLGRSVCHGENIILQKALIFLVFPLVASVVLAMTIWVASMSRKSATLIGSIHYKCCTALIFSCRAIYRSFRETFVFELNRDRGVCCRLRSILEYVCMYVFSIS